MSNDLGSWPSNLELPVFDPNGSISKEDFDKRFDKIKRRREVYLSLRAQMNDKSVQHKSNNKDLNTMSGFPECDNAKDNRSSENNKTEEKLYSKHNQRSANLTSRLNKNMVAGELNETGSIASPAIMIEKANKKSENVLTKTLLFAIIFFVVFYLKRTA